MRFIPMLLVGVVLYSTGCTYEAPLTKEHGIRIDSSVLGLWEIVPDGNERTKDRERLMVLQYSDTEYLVHYPTNEDGFYFRGYPIKVGDVSCVQLQGIGTEGGPIGKQQKELFHVVSYSLVNGELLVKTLNTELVDDDLKDTGALRNAFLKHKDNTELFANPGRFRRVEEKS